MNKTDEQRKRRRREVGPVAAKLRELAAMNGPAMASEVSRRLREWASEMEGGK